MNERRCREIDESPSYHSNGAIFSFREQEVERRKRAAWEISARRRRYELRQMRARMEMEEIFGR
jgi:hypothetical protein